MNVSFLNVKLVTLGVCFESNIISIGGSDCVTQTTKITLPSSVSRNLGIVFCTETEENIYTL